MGFYSGVFSSEKVNPAELNKKSFASTIMRLFPDGAAPIFALTSQTGRSTAVATTHGYFTKTMTFAACKINAGGGYADNITTFVVDTPGTTGMLPKMVLHCPRTRENFRIVTVDSATQITVTRAFGRVAAAALVDNDDLIVIGAAFEQGSARPTSKGLTVTYVPNYTQIFRNAWAVTDTARASLAEAGFSNIQENKRDCALLHSVDIETAIIHGQPKMDTSGTLPVHATQGIIDAVEQYAPGNTNTADAATSYTELIALLEPAWTYSHDLGDTKTRVAFGGATAVKVLNEIGRLNGQYQLVQSQTQFGLTFNRFNFYKGSINLIEHPIFNGVPTMSGLLLVLDMPSIRLAYMNGRDTKPEEYGGTGKNNANGVDAEGGSLTTELAVETLNPAGCAVIYGLTAGAQG